MKKQDLFRYVFPAALLLLSAAIFTTGQDQPRNKHNTRPDPVSVPKPTDEPNADVVKYAYEFSQPKFYVKHIILEHDANGKGTITFERLNEDVPVTEPLQLSAAALGRITALWSALQFLDSVTDYQSKQQFPHLGTMRISMQRATRQRTAEFNWTHDDNASRLVSEYRRAADQAILVFDISIARENQPLNAPKLMEVMESLLTRDGLSDANQLVPLLQDMSTDEHIPLMARNHALRIIKKIQK